MEVASCTDGWCLSTAGQAAALFRAAIPKEQREERVFVLPLDGGGRVLAKPILVSVGHGKGTAEIDVGAVFREALKAGAEEIIVAHNHLSGNLTPSKDDIAATLELKEMSNKLGVAFLDHIIIGSPDSADGTGFVSLAEVCL